MTTGLKAILFFLFLVSGFCGLLYQVVWMRLAFASFGVITPVVSVVISVFMAGLFAGSWGGGKLIETWTRRTGLSGILFYALSEIIIACGAFSVPLLFQWGEAYLPTGEADSAAFLFRSSIAIALAIFPWCVAMGATFPCMMAFVRERDAAEHSSFSFLYVANVLGAMLGVLLTAVVIIELLGFRGTLTFAAMANGVIALIAFALGILYPRVGNLAHTPLSASKKASLFSLSSSTLFLTGFTSMGMEVVWIRAFTPVLRTQVYSFAILLLDYLLATWCGSLIYRKHLNQNRVWSFEKLVGLLAITSLLPLINDPRLGLQGVGAVVSIFPFCAILGYLTPKLIDGYSSGDPELGGVAYGINVLGCILGPLVASYFLLPLVGVKFSLVLLALPFSVLFLSFSVSRKPVQKWLLVGCPLLLLVFFSRTYEEGRSNLHREVRRDHTATVVSEGEGMQKRLLVNGIGITDLTTVTKVMAHLPLASLSRPPSSALVICLGMGTTFRSLSSWGIESTAVELVPSVRDAFPYYFSDATEIIENPSTRIIVDDGRRFLKRTERKFDVITLDPPPPVEAAGSSLLYSEEFYAIAKDHLNEGGILQQWLPTADSKTLQAVTRSLLRSFPYVRMFRSHLGFGNHFLASLSPIENRIPEALVARMPGKAKKDLLEWESGLTATSIFSQVLASEMDPVPVGAGVNQSITDDRPFNEYFLLRKGVELLGRFTPASKNSIGEASRSIKNPLGE